MGMARFRDAAPWAPFRAAAAASVTNGGDDAARVRAVAEKVFPTVLGEARADPATNGWRSIGDADGVERWVKDEDGGRYAQSRGVVAASLECVVNALRATSKAIPSELEKLREGRDELGAYPRPRRTRSRRTSEYPTSSPRRRRETRLRGSPAARLRGTSRRYPADGLKLAAGWAPVGKVTASRVLYRKLWPVSARDAVLLAAEARGPAGEVLRWGASIQHDAAPTDADRVRLEVLASGYLLEAAGPDATRVIMVSLVAPGDALARAGTTRPRRRGDASPRR